MRVLYRKIASVRQGVKYKNSLSHSQISYCIEKIRKEGEQNEVILLIRDLMTNTSYYKKPISLYCDKSVLNLFSYQDIKIIMRHVICQLDHNILDAIKFEGYDYIDNVEVSLFYDMRFKQKQLKELIKFEDNGIFDFLPEKERLYFNDFAQQ